MKFNVKITSASTLEEIENYWKNEDYIKLLGLFDFPDANTIKVENLREMLFMAISDFEPNEAAKILLTYQLSENLNEGQIDQISNDMLLDRICEEYPEIDLHFALFNINQLLFKAFNGKFPNASATKVEFTIEALEKFEGEFTKEVILKALSRGLSDSNIIKRLFADQMSTDLRFEEAEDIIWKLVEEEGSNFSLITSEYWLNKNEIIASEFEGESLLAEIQEE
ncbi:hypothetical protein [Chryseobacterium sp. MP_3.2]|uniref:hypothetical protein n=1 Tax=Chryseobacterium sp. MP_3.2 TaxID=3071712 RepID=UPI002E009E89|nr:hypothetical protein [Chryseobacterium sp. MP_3.2]